jgi:hypothetical protein
MINRFMFILAVIGVSATVLAQDVEALKRRVADLEEENRQLRARVTSLTHLLELAEERAGAQATPQAGTAPVGPGGVDERVITALVALLEEERDLRERKREHYRETIVKVRKGKIDRRQQQAEKRDKDTGRWTFNSREAKAAKAKQIAEWRQQNDQWLDDFARGVFQFDGDLPVRPEVGHIGFIRAFKVRQVIDDRTLLGELLQHYTVQEPIAAERSRYLTNPYRMVAKTNRVDVWVEGLDTARLVDDRGLSLNRLAFVGKTKTYPTANGTMTVLHLTIIDPKVYFDEIRDRGLLTP